MENIHPSRSTSVSRESRLLFVVTNPEQAPRVQELGFELTGSAENIRRRQRSYENAVDRLRNSAGLDPQTEAQMRAFIDERMKPIEKKFSEQGKMKSKEYQKIIMEVEAKIAQVETAIMTRTGKKMETYQESAVRLRTRDILKKGYIEMQDMTRGGMLAEGYLYVPLSMTIAVNGEPSKTEQIHNGLQRVFIPRPSATDKQVLTIDVRYQGKWYQNVSSEQIGDRYIFRLPKELIGGTVSASSESAPGTSSSDETAVAAPEPTPAKVPEQPTQPKPPVSTSPTKPTGPSSIPNAPTGKPGSVTAPKSAESPSALGKLKNWWENFHPLEALTEKTGPKKTEKPTVIPQEKNGNPQPIETKPVVPALPSDILPAAPAKTADKSLVGQFGDMVRNFIEKHPKLKGFLESIGITFDATKPSPERMKELQEQLERAKKAVTDVVEKDLNLDQTKAIIEGYNKASNELQLFVTDPAKREEYRKSTVALYESVKAKIPGLVQDGLKLILPATAEAKPETERKDVPAEVHNRLQHLAQLVLEVGLMGKQETVDSELAAINNLLKKNPGTFDRASLESEMAQANAMLSKVFSWKPIVLGTDNTFGLYRGTGS